MKERHSSSISAHMAVFAGRKWAAPAYGGGADLDGEALCAARAKAEGEWAARHPQLNFPYSGARVPKAKWFREVLRDYLADKVANAHHLLACLSGNPWSKLQPHLGERRRQVLGARGLLWRPT